MIGTAGHIDHGKTSIVKALTGTDTDTLNEEKKRAESLLKLISPSLDTSAKITIEETLVEAGSGTLPVAKFESVAFKILSKKYSSSKLSKLFREANYPVIGFVKSNNFYLDFKSIIPFQEKYLLRSIVEVLGWTSLTKLW